MATRKVGPKLLAGGLLLGTLALAVVFGLPSQHPLRTRSVTEFRAAPSFDETVRVSGVLVPGTLCKMKDRCEYHFRIYEPHRSSDPSAELPVRYEDCILPDTLRDVPGHEVQLAIEGELCSGCHVFAAKWVMAKSSGKYELYDDGSPVHDRSFESCNARGEPSM